MGTGPAWPAARGPPLFRSRTPRADAGRDGLPGRDHPRADQVPEFIRTRHAGAWAAFADRRAAGEAEVRGCDRRGGISASARRTHRRCRRQAARMIGGEWKRAGGDRHTPLLVRFRLYRTPAGVISGLRLFRSARILCESNSSCPNLGLIHVRPRSQMSHFDPSESTSPPRVVTASSADDGPGASKSANSKCLTSLGESAVRRSNYREKVAALLALAAAGCCG